MAYSREMVVRFKFDGAQAERGIRRFGVNLSRLGQFTRSLRAGMLGMNTMLMGQGAVMVGAGLPARRSRTARYGPLAMLCWLLAWSLCWLWLWFGARGNVSVSIPKPGSSRSL